MGLDMYLVGKHYPLNLEDGDGDQVEAIHINLGYWRKANAVHKWFVDMVQSGKDDCGEYPVKTEQLELLMQQCRKVLDGQATPTEAMPTQAGFFFGSLEYDGYYLQDLENTIAICEKAIKKVKNNDRMILYYRSSW